MPSRAGQKLAAVVLSLFRCDHHQTRSQSTKRAGPEQRAILRDCLSIVMWPRSRRKQEFARDPTRDSNVENGNVKRANSDACGRLA